MAVRNEIEKPEGLVNGFDGRRRAFCNSDALDVDEIGSVSNVTDGRVVLSVVTKE